MHTREEVAATVTAVTVTKNKKKWLARCTYTIQNIHIPIRDMCMLCICLAAQNSLRMFTRLTLTPMSLSVLHFLSHSHGKHSGKHEIIYLIPSTMFLYVRFDTKIHHKFHFRSDSKMPENQVETYQTQQYQQQQHRTFTTTATSQSLWGKINFYLKLHFTLIDSNQISMPFLYYHIRDYSTKFRKTN